MFFATLTLATLTHAKITDYSHADYIPIIDGNVIIWNETWTVRHTTNLTAYDTFVSETANLVEIFTVENMKKVLQADVEHLTTLLATLHVHHRRARSINLLGSALKVLAGTPDFDDLQRTRLIEQDLINANNNKYF